MAIHSAKRRSQIREKAASRMKVYEGTPFRLTDIEIKNVRCFEHVKIGLEGPNGPKSWAVILGDNGVGKTTLLRCIAIGMCDEASASGLLREIYGDWNRKVGDELLKAEIRLTFCTDNGPARITTIIEPRTTGYSRVRQRFPGQRKGEQFPWDAIFACGYGAARRSFGSKDVADYATIDAVYTLFNYDEPLQNPELVLRRLNDSFREKDGKSKKAKAASHDQMKRLLNSLCSILMLPPDSITLDAKGLVLSGPWGDFQPIGGLGDGFQATLSWLTDLIGWALLYGDDRPLSELTGIVLIDEIEQHLHPRWQRQIIKLLHDHFPNVQFLATTHTPMCAIGTTDLADEECELIKLKRQRGSVVAREDIEPPRGMRADQVLTSFLFELPTAGDNRTLGDIARFNELKTRKRLDRHEQQEMKTLHNKLKMEFGADESDFETAVRKEVSKALKKLGLANVSLAAADIEVVRLLREMAGE